MNCTGHWIHDCPTNNDREYDNKPRIKRTTGIPRSFLKAIDQPSEGKVTQGVMVTPDGGYVVAQPDLCVVQFTYSATSHSTPTTQSVVAEAGNSCEGSYCC